MKKLKVTALAIVAIFLASFLTFSHKENKTLEVSQIAYAQEVEASVQPLTVIVKAEPEIVAPTPKEWSSFLEQIGGVKGAGTFALIVAIVQGLLLTFRTSIGALAGRYQLTVVTLLTLIVGVLTLKLSGFDWPTIFLHSSTLTAVQVFLNQIYKQFVVKDN